MNIELWRSHIIAADWRTGDIDLVSLELSSRYRSTRSTSITLPCKAGLGLDVDCDRQQAALAVLEQHGFVKCQSGELTDGCCFGFDRIEMLDV